MKRKLYRVEIEACLYVLAPSMAEAEKEAKKTRITHYTEGCLTTGRATTEKINKISCSPDLKKRLKEALRDSQYDEQDVGLYTWWPDE